MTPRENRGHGADCDEVDGLWSEGQPDLRRGVEIDSAGARVRDANDNLVLGMEANSESHDPWIVTR